MPSDLPQISGIEGLLLDRRTSDEHVYTGIATSDGAPVRVRLFRSLYPNASQLAARRHAMEISHVLAGVAGVLGHRELVPTGFDLALVTDAPAFDDLDRWMQSAPYSTRDRLIVAGSLAAGLAGIHKCGVTHNALSPSVVGIEDALTTSIGGLDRAMNLRSEVSGASQLTSSLTYVSPEQTGRMNRPVDNRSDLYSLGAIIFHLFAGTPPFTETDVLTLMHAHVARPAPRLRDVVPGVPAALDDIVATLLAKDPDRRYQTASGVRHDLALVEQSLEGVAPITLRSTDVSDQFVMSEHLYGRESELEYLRDAFDRAARGERNAVWVSGYSGIGKSSFVHELEPLVVARFGWFAEGKFDLVQRDVPYVGWLTALEGIARQIMALPAEDLALLRHTLTTRVGAGASDLVRFCSDLASVFGAHDAFEEAEPHEAQVRLARALAAFIASVASPQRPLVLFLDDLQWADLASLHLLHAVLTDPNDSAVLVVGAWRENEITLDHPVRWIVQKLDDENLTAPTIELAPITLADVQSIVADAIKNRSDAARELGALTYEKTGGNPFFLRQFLQATQREHGIFFDAVSLQWTWEMDAIRSRGITDNVAELLADRLDTISSETLMLLQAAAIVGTTFALSEVINLAEVDFPTGARALDDALTAQLITPLDEQYRYVLSAAPLDGGNVDEIGVNPSYAFLHDRVHQATLDSIEEGARRGLHRKQAALLGESGGGSDTVVVEVASHLCEALELIVAPEEKVAAATTLVRSARRAKSTMALSTATRFLDAGIQLLPDDAWNDAYQLALELHTESADVAYIDGRYDDAARATDEVLAKATEVLDRVAAHNIVIGVGVARADYQRATQYALDVLDRDFGVDIRRHPSMARVAVELAECRAAIGRRRVEDLLSLPPMTDPTWIAVMGIMMKTATNAYWAEPNLVPVIAARMIRLSLAHGNDSLSAYGYALYAMVTSGVLGAEATGYNYGRLAMDLLERWPNRSLVGRTALLWHGFVRHSRDPMRECVSELFDSYHSALDAGDVENACYCATVGYYASILSGTRLGLLDRYRGYVETVMLSGQAQTREALAAWLQAIVLLQSPVSRTGDMTGAYVDWPSRRSALIDGGDGTALPTEASAAGFFAFVMDDMTEAEENLALVWEHRDGGPGQVYLGPCFALYAAVILRRRANGDRRPTDRARLVRLRRAVRTRANHNSHDMTCFAMFVEAESHRCSGRRAQAIWSYLDAASEARRHDIAYLEAIALDEAGTLEAAAGHAERAAHLVASASDVWRHIGVPYRVQSRAERDAETREASSMEEAVGEAIDPNTLIEMMQTISREIEVASLLERVLSLVMRNAGASHGVLFVVNDGVARSVVEGESTNSGTLTITTTDDEREASYVGSVVDYVVRTSKALLIENAALHELIRHDRHARRDVEGSILCAPLVQAGALVGVVYLANHEAAGVFTRRQMVVVETICGQAAVSLRNARLFEEQRSQAESFARFVPRPFLEQLGRSRVSDVGLGDAVTVDVTVCFSDLRGFTHFSEGSNETETFKLLNRYLGRMEPVIRQHGGFIDKYFGDGVMSLFIDGADGAVNSAIEMNRALDALNGERQESANWRMGIGIHAGEVMLGTVGTAERLDTTVIGDTVNTASRLEGATKDYCATVLVSRQVLDRLLDAGRYLLREVGRVALVGKSEVLELHEVLAARSDRDADAMAIGRGRFAEGLAHWYDADFSAAARLFRECAVAAPCDALALRYATRCDEYLVNPPTGAWNGVEVMTTK